MKLIDAIRNVDEADGKTICARRPWRDESDACLVPVERMSRIPEQILENGYEYFLEATILREVLEMPEAKKITEEKRLELAIYYAEHDAYPPWIFSE